MSSLSTLNQALYYRQMAALPFGGRSDKFLRSRQVLPLTFDIEQAINGTMPYDVTGVAINNDQRDFIAQRLARYYRGQDFYDGNHFINPFHDGERKTVFNFCGVIVDKGVNWHEAKGWKVVAVPGNEDVAKYLNYVWAYNNRGVLSLTQAQFGAIKGDSYYYVTVRTKDEMGNKLPRNKWTVRIQTINPSYVFPIWSDTEAGKMKACLIQMPVNSPDLKKIILLSIWITPEQITTFENTDIVDQIDNPLKEVNVAYVPNFPLSDSQFGKSDIEDIIPINEEYNAIAYSIRRIIKYHAEPTTVIYGVRASQLEKGANSVWSGLPETAKVENLQLQGDLKANFEYLQQLRNLISELSHTPKIAFDGTETLPARTSAAVIELAFQPLLEKTRQRQKAHAPAIREVNRLIMRFETEVIRAFDVSTLADSPDRLEDTDVEYTTPLPRDEAQDLDLNIKKYNAGVISQAELMRVCSNVQNFDRLVLEVLADKRADLAEAYENQRALNGERPNSLATFLGSETLSVDMMRIMNEIAVLERLGGDQTDSLVKKDAAAKNTPVKRSVKVRVKPVMPRTPRIPGSKKRAPALPKNTPRKPVKTPKVGAK